MSKLLTDHDEIQHWATSHAGNPGVIYTPDGHGGDNVILKITFGQRIFATDNDESRDQIGGVEQVSWPEWFKLFDAHNLALRVPDSTDGNPDGLYSFEQRD